MSAHSNNRAIRETPDTGTAPPEPSVPPTDSIIIPDAVPNWRDEEFDSSPNTVNALSEAAYDRYVEAVEELTDRFGLSVVHPKSGYGVCHRRHDSLGKHGVVSFETRLG